MPYCLICMWFFEFVFCIWNSLIVVACGLLLNSCSLAPVLSDVVFVKLLIHDVVIRTD